MDKRKGIIEIFEERRGEKIEKDSLHSLASYRT